MTTPLDEKILQLQQVKNAIKIMEAEETALSEEIISAMFEQARTDYLIPRQLKAVILNKTTKTISAEKLVAKGVEMHKIEAATSVTNSAPFVRLYPQSDDE